MYQSADRFYAAGISEYWLQIYDNQMFWFIKPSRFINSGPIVLVLVTKIWEFVYLHQEYFIFC